MRSEYPLPSFMFLNVKVMQQLQIREFCLCFYRSNVELWPRCLPHLIGEHKYIEERMSAFGTEDDEKQKKKGKKYSDKLPRDWYGNSLERRRLSQQTLWASRRPLFGRPPGWTKNAPSADRTGGTNSSQCRYLLASCSLEQASLVKKKFHP